MSDPFLVTGATLDFTAARSRAILQNLANAEVADYRPVDVEFADLVEAASAPNGARREAALRALEPRLREDGRQGVDLETELARLYQNALHHRMAVEFAQGKLRSLRSAISGRF